MKKFSLILIVLTFVASTVYAGNIPGYSDMFDSPRIGDPEYADKLLKSHERKQRQWEDEQRLRRLENRQQQLEERYNKKEPEPLLWPRSKPGDSLFK